MPDYSVRHRVLKIIASRDGSVVWSGGIAQGEATIGRSPSSQVVLDDPLVSWTHAVVSVGKTGIVFSDRSTNGSFRNGERVTTINLGPGGLISIPPFEIDLSLETVGDPGRPRPPAAAGKPPAGQALASTVPESPSQSPAGSGAVSRTSSETLTVTSAPSLFSPSVLQVGVVGRLDGYTYGEFKEVIARIVDEGHRFLIVNLSKCQYCDHAGLGVLVNAQVSLMQKKGGLRIIGLNAQLKDAVRLLRLDDVLSLAVDEQRAASELSALAGH